MDTSRQAFPGTGSRYLEELFPVSEMCAGMDEELGEGQYCMSPSMKGVCEGGEDEGSNMFGEGNIQIGNDEEYRMDGMDDPEDNESEENRSSQSDDGGGQDESVFSVVMAHIENNSYSTPVRSGMVRSEGVRLRESSLRSSTGGGIQLGMGNNEAAAGIHNGKGGRKKHLGVMRSIGSVESWLSQSGLSLDELRLHELKSIWDLANRAEELEEESTRPMQLVARNDMSQLAVSPPEMGHVEKRMSSIEECVFSLRRDLSSLVNTATSDTSLRCELLGKLESIENSLTQNGHVAGPIDNVPTNQMLCNASSNEVLSMLKTVQTKLEKREEGSSNMEIHAVDSNIKGALQKQTECLMAKMGQMSSQESDTLQRVMCELQEVNENIRTDIQGLKSEVNENQKLGELVKNGVHGLEGVRNMVAELQASLNKLMTQTIHATQGSGIKHGDDLHGMATAKQVSLMDKVTEPIDHSEEMSLAVMSPKASELHRLIHPVEEIGSPKLHDSVHGLMSGSPFDLRTSLERRTFQNTLYDPFPEDVDDMKLRNSFDIPDSPVNRPSSMLVSMSQIKDVCRASQTSADGHRKVEESLGFGSTDAGSIGMERRLRWKGEVEENKVDHDVREVMQNEAHATFEGLPDAPVPPSWVVPVRNQGDQFAFPMNMHSKGGLLNEAQRSLDRSQRQPEAASEESEELSEVHWNQRTFVNTEKHQGVADNSLPFDGLFEAWCKDRACPWDTEKFALPYQGPLLGQAEDQGNEGSNLISFNLHLSGNPTGNSASYLKSIKTGKWPVEQHGVAVTEVSGLDAMNPKENKLLRSDAPDQDRSNVQCQERKLQPSRPVLMEASSRENTDARVGKGCSQSVYPLKKSDINKRGSKGCEKLFPEQQAKSVSKTRTTWRTQAQDELSCTKARQKGARLNSRGGSGSVAAAASLSTVSSHQKCKKLKGSSLNINQKVWRR